MTRNEISDCRLRKPFFKVSFDFEAGSLRLYVITPFAWSQWIEVGEYDSQVLNINGGRRGEYSFDS